MKTLLLLHELPDLKTLSGAQKDALIEQLWQEHQALQKVLAGRGNPPKKTAENSSLPPSKGFKKNQPAKIEGVKRQASVGRADGGRALQPQPHQTIVVQAKQCPHCGSGVSGAAQQIAAVYEKIELPKMRSPRDSDRTVGRHLWRLPSTLCCPCPGRDGTRFTLWTLH